MYSVLNCHYVAKHTEFYLGWLRSRGLPLVIQGNHWNVATQAVLVQQQQPLAEKGGR
jgi:hypothetical protein